MYFQPFFSVFFNFIDILNLKVVKSMGFIVENGQNWHNEEGNFLNILKAFCLLNTRVSIVIGIIIFKDVVFYLSIPLPNEFFFFTAKSSLTKLLELWATSTFR